MLDVVAKHLHKNKRTNAKLRSIDFSITVDDLKAALTAADVCPYSGKKLTDKNYSVERIDARLGYIPGNIMIVDVFANQTKSIIDAYLKERKHTAAQKIGNLKNLRSAIQLGKENSCPTKLLPFLRCANMTKAAKVKVVTDTITLINGAPLQEFLFGCEPTPVEEVDLTVQPIMHQMLPESKPSVPETGEYFTIPEHYLLDLSSALQTNSVVGLNKSNTSTGKFVYDAETGILLNIETAERHEVVVSHKQADMVLIPNKGL